MTSWESVLVDWCNCLELSQKVEELNELRDGAFFKKIFGVLNKSNNPKNEEETIKDFMYLLHDTYKNCKMKCSKCASFSEFTEDELVIFTSLLMHYTCINDRRDVLTSPLCHRLSKNTQLLIKQFLQMVNKEITPSGIQKMMKKCAKTLKNTPKTSDCASPLTPIFETPVSKNSKLHEKDKEIAKLKSALEMESYEKADLQEELKLQVEKTKRLENLLNKSNVDMTRLRREITTLECRTPPHFRAMDSSDTEKRLKKEIQSLEHYIEKTEKEQEEIRDECYSNRKKLAELQNQFGELQTKYFEAEKQIEEFNKQSTEQTVKISSLESYCDELNGLLDEYRRKPENESFLETSTISVRRSLPRVEENLACSVVEVQLKEAYMENEELLSKIHNLNAELDENAKNMHAKIEECENKCWKMYEETRQVEELRIIMRQMKCDYNENVEEFNNSFQNLRQLLNNIVKNYEKSESELNSEKNKTQSLTDKLKETAIEFQESVKSFENEIQSLKLNNEQLVSNVNLAEETNTKNSNKIKELVKVIDDLKLNCQELTIQKDELLNNFEETRIEKELLQKIIETKANELSKITNEKVAYLSDITTLKSESEEFLRKNQQLVSELENKSRNIESLEKHLKDVEEKLNLASNNRDEFKKNLEFLEVESKQLNNQIEELLSKLSLSEEMNVKVSLELQTLQQEIKLKEEEFINEKNEMLSISKSERDQLDSEKNELINKLSISDDANKKYSTDVESLKEFVDQKEGELREVEAVKGKYFNEIQILRSENVDLSASNEELKSNLFRSEETIKEYATEVQSLKENMDQKEEELRGAEAEKRKYLNEIQISRSDNKELSAQIEEFKSDLLRSEETIKRYLTEVQSLKEIMDQKEQELKEAEVEKQKYLNEIDNLRSENVELSAQIEEFKSNLFRSEETIKEYLIEVQSLKEIMDQKERELKEAEAEKRKYLNEIQILRSENEELSAQNEEFKSNLFHSEETIEKYSTEVQSLKEFMDQKEQELKNAEAEKQKYLSEIQILRSENEELLSQNEEFKSNLFRSEESIEKYSSEVQSLKELMDQKEQELKNAEAEKQKYLNEIQILRSENEEFQSNLSRSEEAIKNYTADIQSLKEFIDQKDQELKEAEGEKGKFSHEIQMLKSKNDDLCTQNDEFKSNLSLSEEIIKKYTADVQSLQEIMDQKDQQLKDTEGEKQKYLHEIQTLKSKNEEMCIQNEEFKSNLTISEEIITNYTADVQSLEEFVAQKERDLKNSEDEKANCLQEIQNLKSQNEQLNAQNEEFQSNISRSVETIKKVSADVESFEETVALKERDLKNSEDEKANCLQEIQTLRSQSEQLNAQNEELRSNLSRSEETIKKFTADVESLEKAVTQKERDLKNSEVEKANCLEEIQTLKSQNEQLNAHNEELRSNLSGSEETIKKYSMDVQSLKGIMDQKEQELKDSEGKKENYSHEIEILKSKNEQLNCEIKEFSVELSRCKEANSEAMNNLEKLRKDAKDKEDELNHTIDELKKNVENLNSKCLQKQELETNLIISLQENVKLNEKELNNAKNEIIKLVDELETLKRDYEQSNADNKELLSKLKLSEEMNMNIILSLETDIKQRENEFDRAIGEKKELIENLTSNNNELISNLKTCEEKYLCDIGRLEEIIDAKKNENEKLVSRIQCLEKNIEEELNILRNERDQYFSDADTLNGENKEFVQKISILEEKVIEFEQLTLQNQEMTSKMMIYDKKLEKLKSLNECVEYLKEKNSNTKALIREDLNNYESLMEKLQEALKMYDGKLRNNELQLEIEKNMKESLLDKYNVVNETNIQVSAENESIRKDYISLIKTIGMYNEELNKVVKNLKKGRELSPELSEVQIAYSKFNIMSPIKSKEAEKSDEIFELGQQISKINAYIDVYIEKETFYQKEIDNLKTELANLNGNYFNLTENFKEQNSDNEYQITSLTENLHSVVGKYNQLQTDHREYLNKISGYETEIVKLKKLHAELMVASGLDKMKLQEDILKLEEELLNLKRNRDEVEGLQVMKLEYESKIEDFGKKLDNMSGEFAARVEDLQIQLSRNEVELEALRKKCKEKNKSCKSVEEYETLLAKLQVQVVASKLEVTKLEKEIQKLTIEKENLLGRMTNVEEELEQEKTNGEKLHKQLVAKEILLEELETMKREEETSSTKFLEEKQVELQQKIDMLMKSNDVQKQTYEFFKLYYAQFKEKLDKLLSQKNILENLTTNLRILVASINKIPIHETPNFRKLMEKKEAMEIISEDIMKQYSRYSKRINDIIFDTIQYYERNCDNLLSSLIIEQDNYLDAYDMLDLSDQASDLTERTADALEQIKTLQKDLDNLSKAEEDVKTQKENILGTSNKINVEKMKEDELKKKNLALKQKVTLLDNAKNNLEKTVKKLREENRKLKETPTPQVPDNDVHYKMLLQEYIAYKEEQQKIVDEYRIKLENLQKIEHQDERLRTSTPFGDEHFSMERLQADLLNLQEAYANIRTINAKLEAETVRSRKVIEHHEQEAMKFNSIKEAYDKLLEENSKLMTDVDTIKYKRTRDRDEFVRLLKEKSDNENRNTRHIQNVKAEYEAKLERMKDKMIKLYREELNKEMNKVKAGQHENSSLLKMIEKLRGDLFEAEQKNQLHEMEREMQKPKLEHFSSRESLFFDGETKSLKDFSSVSNSANLTGTKPRVAAPMEFKHPRKVNPSSLETRKQYEERRASTLPRTGTVLEEITISRRTSVGVPGPAIGQNLEMEDEEEMFNNKYLADLKQGKCDLPSVGDRDSRVSELAWRNSLVPPHLKSSYPAEMQFCSPTRFKDDDLKASNVQFDDSLSKLLPTEKSRKKDSGTTSYKKPGPPTPSKNGGRLSLQGNEIHPARDTYEVKRSTPSRIRALFTGRNSSKSSSEVATPPKRRLSIFRR